jgi:hypothetical protein
LKCFNDFRMLKVPSQYEPLTCPGFPRCHPETDQMYMNDNEIITCRGGTSALDLAFALIETRCGKARAVKGLTSLLVDRHRAFQHHAGEPPTAVCRKMRLAHGRWLLLNTARTVTQIAIAAAVSVIDFKGVVIDAMLLPAQRAALVAAVAAALQALDLTGTSPLALREGSIGPRGRVCGAAILPLIRQFSPDRQLLVKKVVSLG